jgi:hypothetical protein
MNKFQIDQDNEDLLSFSQIPKDEVNQERVMVDFAHYSTGYSTPEPHQVWI